MKKWWKSLWCYIEGLRGLILILYTTFIFSAYFYFTTEKETYWIRWTIFILALSTAICPQLIRWIRKTDFCRAESEQNKRKKDQKWKWIFLLIPFSALLVKYIIYYPGAFSTDSLWQYEQATTGSYNDWHPVIQTLLSIKLSLMLTGGWIGSIVLFQIIALGLTISYALITIQEYAGERFAFLSMLFIVLNPTISNTAMFPWKDVTFGIGALLLVSYSFRIYMTHGKWLRKPVNAIIFSIVTALTSLVRHNGPLFTVPLMLAVVILVGWRKTIVICIGIVLVIAGVKGPLYSIIGVQAREESKIEMLGLPLNMIAGVTKYAPQDLDEETLSFVQRAAPGETWNRYEYGNFNNVKWDPAFDDTVIEDNANRMIPMAVSCFINQPREVIKSLIRLTDVVYTICDDYKYFDFPFPAEEEYGFEKGGIPALQSITEKVSLVLYTALPWLFLYVGAMHYVLLTLALSKHRMNKGKDWKKILFIIPVFTYNFGTALLLTSAHDSARFFQYTFLVTPVLAALLCRNETSIRSDGSCTVR